MRERRYGWLVRTRGGGNGDGCVLDGGELVDVKKRVSGGWRSYSGMWVRRAAAGGGYWDCALRCALDEGIRKREGIVSMRS